ncbi:hypothetical protein BDV41DRAFT_564065 [Aspergillus transmontanensis]|uniref:Major facilitator superfamily domain-containing protein n=1 Tax=Aspergillus transmontanensis TaxID=1034304 RepID=A0A5N6W085_9EURO|nr:hypothetical protein BDV41DRAFT_564065 [Aspergillus transmontanensis]
MQAYLQYRSIRNAVRRQLDDLPDRARASLHDGMFRPEVTDVSHGFSSLLPGVELLEKSDDHGNHCEVFLVGWDHDEDPMNPRNFTVTTPGSLVSGPLSEILGRNIVYIGSTSLFMVFIMASSLAPDIGAQLAFRFLAGVFGCPPLTCAGGTISRWTNWIVLIMAGLVLGLVVLFKTETYSPLLLKWKAHHLRQLTGDPRYQSKLDLDRTSLLSRIVTACGRQFTLAINVAMYVGIMLAGLIVPGMYSCMKNAFKEEIPSGHDNNNENGTSSNGQSPLTKSSSLNPVNRLWYAMIGAPAIPISLFWMGWTDYVSHSCWGSIL